jgi:solute carrier family 36 (proton-coupled amino acid transporter)
LCKVYTLNSLDLPLILSCILSAMPIAFSRAGLLGGVLGIILTGIICTHCASILVTCARILHRRTGHSAMTFPQIAKFACESGPAWSRPFANVFKYTLMHFLFLSYFGASAAYTVVVAKSVQQLVDHHWDITVDLRLYLVALVLPFVLISWIPKLKWLTKVTFMANMCMLIGLIILVNFLVTDMSPVLDRPMFAHVSTLPSFFAIVIFAFEAIGVIMPLEKHGRMDESEEYTSRFGVMAQGLTMILAVYIVIGFLGYVKYGDAARGSITLNLPDDYM